MTGVACAPEDNRSCMGSSVDLLVQSMCYVEQHSMSSGLMLRVPIINVHLCVVPKARSGDHTSRLCHLLLDPGRASQSLPNNHLPPAQSPRSLQTHFSARPKFSLEPEASLLITTDKFCLSLDFASGRFQTAAGAPTEYDSC